MNMHKSAVVAEGVYFYLWVGQTMNCNSVVLADVFEGDKPHVLIDPGMVGDTGGNGSLDSLAAAMAADGLKLEDVGLVIGTHSHPDHFQSVDEVVRRSGARVALSEVEYGFLQGDGGAMYGSFDEARPSVVPSVLLHEGKLDLGPSDGWDVDIIIAPGHTPGSACLYLGKSKVLVGGDVIFPCSIGRMDFVGGSVSQMRDSIRRLSELDIECILPGHSSQAGPLVAGKDNVVRNFQLVRAFF